MAQGTHDLFRAFCSAHGVMFELNIPLMLRTPALSYPVAVVVEPDKLMLTVPDAPGEMRTQWERTFMAVASTYRDALLLNGVASVGQLASLESGVPTWHALHQLLLGHPNPRWKAFSWAAELFRLVGDAKPVAEVKPAPVRHRRKLAA